MSGAADVERLKGQIAKKLGRIFECTRLLDLNRSDGEFRRLSDTNSTNIPNEIFFVVDTNFIQAFLDPMLWRHSSRLFHDSIWPPRHRERKDYESLIDSIGAQSTLLATEFVLSDWMKGANSSIYMSRVHYEEMLKQFEYFRTETNAILEKLSARDAAAIKESHEKIDVLAKLREKDRSFVSKFMETDTDFLAYGEALTQELTDAKFNRVRDDYIVSSICKILAEDEIAEPIEQFRRLLEDNLWNRIGLIEDEFDTIRVEEQKELLDEERVWLQRLQAEFALREQRDAARVNGDAPVRKSRRKRQRASLVGDAKTLATVSWATKKRAGPHQRIVFVTGDRLILDAYRRWYGEDASGASFLIRPLAQFAPQFNLRDAGAPLSKEVGVFDRTREALEASTFSLTFSLIDHYFEDPRNRPRLAGARAKDRFCVEVQYDGDHSSVLKKLIGPMSDHLPTLINKAADLDRVADSLRWTERLAIGAAPELVRNRVRDVIGRVNEFFESLSGVQASGGDDVSVIGQWFQTRLRKAMESGFQFSVPIAVAQVIELDKRPQRLPARAPVSLHIQFPLGNKRVSATQWLSRLAQAPKSARMLQDLARQPALIFALASWLAFRHNLYSDTTRFADLASTAAAYELKKSDSPEVGAEEVLDECLYLKAVALRFRMASEVPTAAHDTDAWRRDLIAAEEALSTCIEHRNNPDQKLRSLRAYAERAAVRLTYCAWAATLHLGALSVYRKEHPTLAPIFDGAVNDLVTCDAGLNELARDDLAADNLENIMWQDTLRAVRRQALFNPECARILYDRLRQPIDPVGGWGYLPLMSNVEEQLEKLPRPENMPGVEEPSIVSAYALSSKARRSGGVERRQALLDTLDISEESQTLPLDLEMLKLIKRSSQRELESVA